MYEVIISNNEGDAMHSFYCYLVLFFLLFFSCNKVLPTETIIDDDIVMIPDVWYNISPGQNGNPEDSYFFLGLYFINSNKGWVVGRKRPENDQNRGIVCITENGGESWTEVLVPEVTDLEHVYFFNQRIGIAINNAYGPMRTTDGGNTWQLTPISMWALRGIAVDEANSVWGVRSWGEGTFLINSNDQGATWQVLENSRINDELTPYFLAIGALKPQNIIMAGQYQPGGFLGSRKDHLILHTINGGNSWEEIFLPEELLPYGEYIDCVKFIDDLHGWIGCDYRTIIHTIDGGTTWVKQELGIGNDSIYSIDAIDENHAIAVTSNAAILVTKNGGEQWEEILAPSTLTHRLIRVQYLESNFAYALGQAAVLKAKISR